MAEENKDLVRSYLSAIDANKADDWDVLDSSSPKISWRIIRRLRARRWTGKA